MSDHVAAIDGGGTKTLVATATRAGDLQIAARLAGCNPQDNPDWAATLDAALSSLRDVAFATLGLPGFGEVPAIDATLSAYIARHLPAPHRLLNDVEMAARGAFPAGTGVLILSGTGSMAMAVSPLGLTRSGGWGDAFGDEGSAYAIGQAALRLVAQMIDGRAPDTGFAEALCARLGPPATHRPFGPMDWLLAHPHGRSALASVAAHVDTLAEQGDPTARGLLQAAARDLARLGQSALQRAGLPDTTPWSAAGSVFRSRTIRGEVAALMGRDPAPPALPALGGGLFLAATAAGWEPGADWCARIAQALSEYEKAPA